MDINDLIAIVKKKLKNKIVAESIRVEDKSFLHKNHPGNQKGKFHLKILINWTKKNHIHYLNLSYIF